jgi:integrase
MSWLAEAVKTSKVVLALGVSRWFPHGLRKKDGPILRTSCATDWVERYPSHVVAKWLGHSPKVAAQQYLMSKDRHFEDVVGGGSSEAR